METESLIYSLNATVPVFLVIVLGYVLGKLGMFSDGFISSANKLIFNVCLPVMLFKDMAEEDIVSAFNGSLVIYCAVITTLAVALIWGGAKLFIKDKTITGAFVQASYRSSVAVLGAAFMLNIFGTVGEMPMIIIGCVPLYNIYAVIVLSFEANGSYEGSRKDKLKNAASGIVKNPIIIGIAVGLIGSVIHIYDHLPVIIMKSIDSVSAIASPLSLIIIGASFEGRKAIARIKPTIISCIIKLVVLPAVFIFGAILLGFRDESLIALVIMLGSPTTPSCYIMAKNMNNDGVLTSSVIAATTLLSALTLTFWIFIIKYMGYVC